MKQLPVFFNLKGRRVLLIGATEAAFAKGRLLVAAGAQIVLFDVPADFNLPEDFKPFDVNANVPAASELSGAVLIFISTGSEARDKALAELALQQNVLVNVVDRPHLSTFSTPAIVDRDPVTIAISTGGAAPALARRLRRMIDGLLPSGLGNLARVSGEFRTSAAALISNGANRRRFWDRVFGRNQLAALSDKQDTDIRSELIRLANTAANDQAEGRVLLVGAGPGDPDLLTLKAHRALSEADVIVHDKLVSDAVLDYARRDARRIFVGKSRAKHTVPQDEINAILVREAMAGNMVVRLKGGDPLIFGRAGEEIEALRAAGVELEIVPGITAAAGCAASAEIPLTHRDHSQAVTFATGQLREGQIQDWSGLAGGGRTLVIYMGLKTAAPTVDALIRDGFDTSTPVAVIENGTRVDERKIFATLETLVGELERNNIVSPSLIVIGEVSSLAKDYDTSLNRIIENSQPLESALG